MRRRAKSKIRGLWFLQNLSEPWPQPGPEALPRLSKCDSGQWAWRNRTTVSFVVHLRGGGVIEKGVVEVGML